MYVELFAPGNVILCDCDNLILNSFSGKKFKDRTIKPREIYNLPPKKNLFDILDCEILEKFKELNMSLIPFLAKNFYLGGKYATEITQRLKFDEKNFKVAQIKEMIKKLLNCDLKPQICKKNGEYYDFIPFDFESYKDFEKENFPSFNLATSNYFEKEKVVSSEIKKLKEKKNL